jgi:hypothetical protein
MKTLTIYSVILICFLLIGCRTYDKDGYWSDKSRRSVDVAEPAQCNQYLLLYETDRYQVFACPSAFEQKEKMWRQYPDFKTLQGIIGRSDGKDTVVCFAAPDNGQVNAGYILSFIEDELCWIYDKQTGKFVDEVVIEDWEWGHRDGGLVGATGTTIYIGDEVLMIIIASMA